MIIFQFRSGEMKYFSNKYVIISQRMMTSRTARAAVPSVLIKAYGKLGPGQWIDVTSPIIMFNPATGKHICRFDSSQPLYGSSRVASLHWSGDALRDKPINGFRQDLRGREKISSFCLLFLSQQVIAF